MAVFVGISGYDYKAWRGQFYPDELPARRPLELPARRTMVRGIFSLSQLARQLGVAVQTGGEVARTFSEIESAIK